MQKVSVWAEKLSAGDYDGQLKTLYVDERRVETERARYQAAASRFAEEFGDLEAGIFSAPGRSEIGGNHTDHQRGEVLAAAVNLDMIAVAAPTEDGSIRLYSEGYGLLTLSANELKKQEREAGTSRGLIRGMLAGLKQRGYRTGGFTAYMTSNVPGGSGLSSSAAFEVLIGTIQSGLYEDGKVDPVVIAQIAQYAENVYFEKPCGLMDQMASSVGGLIHIDFQKADAPVVEKVDVDFTSFGHSLCIVDTKGSHAGLTDEYAGIPQEMRAVAEKLGGKVLIDISEEELYERLPELRKEVGDRPVLRAIHFFEENKRVRGQVAALQAGDFARFKELIGRSGNSSFQYLQNVYTNKHIQEQGLSVGLAVSDQILGEHGVCRVHGGGFAGTIQAFVEDEFVEEYRKALDHVFGEGACQVLKVRPVGGACLTD